MDETTVFTPSENDTSAPQGAQNDMQSISPSEVAVHDTEKPSCEMAPDTDAAEGTDISDDPGENSDPDSGTEPLQKENGELEALRRELNELREELHLKEAKRARLESEFAEFCTLYPEVDVHAVPDAVWNRVESGVPLACAYAAEERRQKLIARVAEKSNEKNRARSGDSIKPAPMEYFSRSEVMAMSADEVHKKFNHILKSMKKW